MKVSTILIFASSAMALAIPNPISRSTATVEKRQFDFVGDFIRNMYNDMNDFAMKLLPGPKIQGLPYGEHNVVPAPPKN